MGHFEQYDAKRNAKINKRPRLARRAYQAAGQSRLTAGWINSPISADAEVYRSLRRVRARSREERNNNPYLARYFGLLTQNVIGDRGISMQAQARYPGGKLDKAANRAIEEWWKRWNDECDYTGQRSWLEMQNLDIMTIAEDGESLTEIISTRDGVKLLAIDPELLDVELNDDNGTGDYVRMGIHFAQSGRRLGYYIKDDTRNSLMYSDGYTYGLSRKEHRYIPASNMIHRFVPFRVGQSRGMPWTTPILWRMQMHHGFVDAAVTASRVGASKMGFFITPSGDEYTGDDQVEAGGEQLIDAAEPGIFEELPEGTSFESFDPNYPHQMFDPFDKAMLRSHASGLNVSYNALANDLEGVNFSSIRAGVLEDREAWKCLQQFTIHGFCKPIYEKALSQALAANKIPIGPNGVTLDIENLDKYLAVNWQGRRWNWVDPLKDQQAELLSYEMGTTSLSAIIRNMGKDPEEVWAERQREQQQMKDYDVTLTASLNAVAGLTETEGGSNE